MVTKKTFDFLKQLKKNNNKEWFDKNRATYEATKAEVSVLVEKLISELSKFEPQVAGLTPKQCLFRINRDVRFSKDKSPYKTTIGASINPGGKKSMIPGYYLHIEPGNSFLAGGMYMPPSDRLAAVRQEIDYNFMEFKKIISNKDFVSYFGKLDDSDKLTSLPRGYAKDNPAIELIKHKSFIVVHQLKDDEVLNTKFISIASKIFKAMQPLNKFLQRATD
ncbi:MAG: DUF2461 domain-containing protein [Bacteroidetes bacterium]|nr:DUF2461 domain-containing protein [Bacteroidota bacterium]